LPLFAKYFSSNKSQLGFTERRQDEAQAEDLSQQAEKCCMASVSSCRERTVFANEGKRPNAVQRRARCFLTRTKFFGRGVRLSPATSEIPVHCCHLQSDLKGTLWRLPALSWRKEGATLEPSWSVTNITASSVFRLCLGRLCQRKSFKT